jgi:hypothetical protein
MTNPVNGTTQHLEQMTTSELTRAHTAAVTLLSDAVSCYIADGVLAAKLGSLRADLEAERSERRKLLESRGGVG